MAQDKKAEEHGQWNRIFLKDNFVLNLKCR